MKKLLTLALTAAMLLQGAVSVFADDASGLALAEKSHLKVENGIVDMIDGTLTVGELKAEFAGAVDVAGKADDALVFADDVVSAGGESAKAIIWGDASKDGKITLTDATRMLQSIAKWTVDISATAADVDRNDKVNLTDVSKLMQKLAKWSDISLGNVRMVFENKKLTAEYEDKALDLSFTSIMNKVGAVQEYDHSEKSYKLKLARNEYDSCTVLLKSETDRQGMTAELSPFVSEFGDAVLEGKIEWTIYEDHAYFTVIDPEHFTFVKANEKAYDDSFPEVVIGMADTFELKAGRNQQFVITVHSTKDTPAGMYKSTLTFRDSEGRAVKTTNVYAYVWDFTLPDTPYSASLFSGHHNPENYEYMLEFNLSDYVLPYEITDERADAYMSDPRVTAFVIAGGAAGPNWEYGVDMYAGIMNKTPGQTIANYNKVMSNPEWAKKGLFYYTDEPFGDGIYKVKTSYEYVTDLLGTTNIRNITPLAGNGEFKSDDGKFVDYVAYIDPYINVWCPQSPAFHLLSEGGLWTSRYFQKVYGDFATRAQEFKAKGEEIWWYVCCAPEAPYANYFTLYQGVVNRLLSWQQYFNDVDGVLYYRTLGGKISKYQFDIEGGDGILQYEARLWGRTGYAASWRLLQVRDGFDDFDYLSMAEELVGREEVMKIVTKVSSGMLKYTEDYRVLEAARDEVAQLILDNQGK